MSSTARSDAALLEREREVAELGEILGAVAGPGTRMALIEGPPGIGKTTLLAETRRTDVECGRRLLARRRVLRVRVRFELRAGGRVLQRSTRTVTFRLRGRGRR